MSEELLINHNSLETRVAVVENSTLQEIYVERSSKRGIVGNIYKGKILRVLPGMQAAFIDIGLEKAAFLHVSDIYANVESFSGEETSHNKKRVTDLLTEGEEVVVQVVKDPLGTKGARLTTQLSIAARDIVFLPGMNHIGVSLKIDDSEERDRLKGLVSSIANPGDGFIIRTNAEGVEDLTRDIQYTSKSWQKLNKKLETSKPGELIHKELPLLYRCLRDTVKLSTKKIRIDNADEVENIKQFLFDFVPEYNGLVEVYNSNKQIFDLYSIEDEINKALDRKVQLKSGGYLVFDLTEAMTVVDVNTGAFVGKNNLEETIFKTNLEAAVAVAKQMKIRNLGGIIVVDFIDMENSEHQRQVLRTLEKEVAKDTSKVNVGEITSLGLVQITRKRSRDSLEQVLCSQCPSCFGRGTLKSAETVVFDIFRELHRMSISFDAKKLLVIASSVVIERLLDEESSYIGDFESSTGISIKFQSETSYTQQQFDVVMI